MSKLKPEPCAPSRPKLSDLSTSTWKKIKGLVSSNIKSHMPTTYPFRKKLSKHAMRNHANKSCQVKYNQSPWRNSSQIKKQCQDSPAKPRQNILKSTRTLVKQKMRPPTKGWSARCGQHLRNEQAPSLGFVEVLLGACRKNRTIIMTSCAVQAKQNRLLPTVRDICLYKRRHRYESSRSNSSREAPSYAPMVKSKYVASERVCDAS